MGSPCEQHCRQEYGAGLGAVGYSVLWYLERLLPVLVALHASPLQNRFHSMRPRRGGRRRSCFLPYQWAEPELYELLSWDLPGRRRRRPVKYSIMVEV